MEANIISAKLEDLCFACFLADENVATADILGPIPIFFRDMQD